MAENPLPPSWMDISEDAFWIPLKTPAESGRVSMSATNRFSDVVAVNRNGESFLVVPKDVADEVERWLNMRRSTNPDGMYGRPWTPKEKEERRAFVVVWQRLNWSLLPEHRRIHEMP